MRKSHLRPFSSKSLNAAMFASRTFACLATDVRGVIQSVSPAAEALFHTEALDLTAGIELMDFCHPQQLLARTRALTAELGRSFNAGFDTLIAKAAQGAADVFDIELLLGDGSRLPATFSVTALLDARGQIQAYLFIVADRRGSLAAQQSRSDLEMQLRESQKMEAVGTLAGGIAHDFNNILAVILGHAELAIQAEGSGDSVQPGLQEIHKAAVRGSELVSQILGFVRRHDSELTPLFLDDVMMETARLLRATLPARLKIEVACAADVPQVAADGNQIMQVLINLAANAMLAMPVGPGVIKLGLETIDWRSSKPSSLSVRTLSQLHPEGAVRMVVSDTGCGMNSETKRRIFDPFFTTRSLGEGTGLGLTIVQGIVRSHYGAIDVDSEPGKGTTFFVYLPMAKPDSTSKPREDTCGAKPLRATKSLRILFVDDDPSVRPLFKLVMERQGHNVASYDQATDAIRALRKDPFGFDLVLSDYNMPGLSGLDLAREAKSIRSDLPVVIASGYIDSHVRTQAQEAGVQELILKACGIMEFCASVSRAAESTQE
jgi:signal transduction histidine kinase/ActR/RegA family two-component response regulator